MSEIFKVAQLESLAVYMNCDCKLFQEFSQDNYLVMFRESIATKTMKPSDYDFILGPINSEAKLKLNPDPESNEIPFSIPKIILNLTMETLRIGLTKSQYQDVMQLIEQFGRMSRAYPYRKFRPHGITYRGHYKVKHKLTLNLSSYLFTFFKILRNGGILHSDVFLKLTFNDENLIGLGRI